MTPETSARQCWHWLAATSQRRVGFGCNGRCAPACGLAFGFASAAPLALCPCEGGVLELSGVFGGKSSLTRSSAFSFRNAAFSASNTSKRTRQIVQPLDQSPNQRVFRGAIEKGQIRRRNHP